ncbi:MAG: hypothetical protein WD226_06830 [Planctomycetota bacterium]
MQRHTEPHDHSELRLIIGVLGLIAGTFLIGLGFLGGAEMRARLVRYAQPPTLVQPAELSLASAGLDADRPLAPTWMRLAAGRNLRARPGASRALLASSEGLRGRLTLPAGTPGDERAVVVATQRRPTATHPADARRARVAADGTFELPLLPGEERLWLSLEARYLRLAGGRLVGLAELAAHDTITLAPSLGARLHGRVEGAGNGVTVELAASATGSAFLSQTTADGTFDFGGLATERTLWLRTVAADARPEPPRALRLAPGEQRAVELSVQRFATAWGLALDAKADPLVGARVRARPALQASGRGDHIALADAAGRFTFDALTPGDWHVSLDESGAERVDLALEPGARQAGLRLYARPALEVAATVAWPAGTRARGGSALLVADNRDERHELALDDEGRVRFERLAPGAWTLRVFATRIEDDGTVCFGSAERRVVLPLEQPALELELGGRGRIDGTVTGPSGRPVDEFTLVARSEHGALFDARIAGARFHLVGLAPGRWDLAVRAGGERGWAGKLSVPLERGEAREVSIGGASGARNDVPRPDLAVALRGQLRMGTETAAGELWIRPSAGPFVAVATDAYGRFDAGNVAPGPAEVRVLLQGCGQPLERTVLVERAGSQRLELVFGTGALEGVVENGDGETLSGLGVVAERIGARSTLAAVPTARTTTDAQGRFFLPFLDAGAWTVVIDGTPVGLARTVFPVVEVGRAAVGERYVVERSAEFVGRVTDEAGVGLANAMLFGSSVDGGTTLRSLDVATDAEGAWNVHGLAPGLWRLVARTADGRTSRPLEVALAAGERREVPTLVVAPAASLRLLPTDATGQPIEAWIELLDQDGRRFEDAATRLGDGTLRFGPLTPGSYWMRATDAAQRSITETVEIAAHDRELTIKFE